MLAAERSIFEMIAIIFVNDRCIGAEAA
jgi:hypothetical protein